MSDAFVGVVASLAAAISLLERGGKKAAPSDRMFEQMLADYRKALENGRSELEAASKEGGQTVPDGWLTIDSAPNATLTKEMVWIYGGRFNAPMLVETDGSYWRAFKSERATPTHWHPHLPPAPPALQKENTP